MSKVLVVAEMRDQAVGISDTKIITDLKEFVEFYEHWGDSGPCHEISIFVGIDNIQEIYDAIYDENGVYEFMEKYEINQIIIDEFDYEYDTEKMYKALAHHFGE